MSDDSAHPSVATVSRKNFSLTTRLFRIVILRCEELDILASFIYYFMDINHFRSQWQERFRDSRRAAIASAPEAIVPNDPTITPFEDI